MTTSSTAAFSDLPVPPVASNVAELRTSTRIVVTEPVRGWLESVKARFNELVQMRVGWDGYRGVPVSFVNANFALRMLEAVCDANAPAPQIVPGSNGDLQIEWHTFSADIELHVRGPNDVHAWRSLGGGDTVERRLSNDFTIVSAWINELAGPSIASGTAAA